MASTTPAPKLSSTGEYLRRLGHTGGVFATGLAVNAITGIVIIGALTRALTPTEYGQLAVLMIFTGLLGLLIVYVVLPGSMSWALGASEEDNDGVVDEQRTTAKDSKVALFTGIVLMVALIVVVMALVVLLRKPLSKLLVHGDVAAGEAVTLVLLAALNAVPTAMSRLLGNILRYGQHPVKYILVDVSRGIAIMVFAIVLAFSGGGSVHTALLLYLAGGAFGALLGAVFMRNDVTPRFSPHDALMIIRRGRPVAPVVVCNWIVLNGDAFFLAQFASPAAVGTYRVATGIARLGSYVASTFLRAWGPMTQSPLSTAMREELSLPRANAATVKYFVLLCCWMLVFLSSFSTVLVRIAPDSYSAAAPLIPGLAAVYMLRVVFILCYNGSQRQSRRRWLFGLFGVALVVFVTGCLLLIPPLGAWGAVIASDLAYAIPVVVMLTVAMREPDAMPLSFGQIGGAMALAGVVTALQGPIGGSSVGLQVAVGLLATAIYPALLILAGIVARDLVKPLGAAMLAVIPIRERVPRRFVRRLRTLSHRDLEVLEALVRRREDPADFAARHGEVEEVVRMHVVVVLRRLSSLPAGFGLRASMSRYVIEDEGVVHHMSLGKRLIADGCDPRSLDALYQVARIVRAIPRRSWPAAPARPDPRLLRRIGSLSR